MFEKLINGDLLHKPEGIDRKEMKDQFHSGYQRERDVFAGMDFLDASGMKTVHPISDRLRQVEGLSKLIRIHRIASLICPCPKLPRLPVKHDAMRTDQTV